MLTPHFSETLLCGAANPGCSRLSAGSLHFLTRRFLPQETLPKGSSVALSLETPCRPLILNRGFQQLWEKRRGCILSWVVWRIRTKIYAPARSIGSARRSRVAIVGLGSLGGCRGKLSDGFRVGCNTDSPTNNKSQQLKSCFPA